MKHSIYLFIAIIFFPGQKVIAQWNGSSVATTTTSSYVGVGTNTPANDVDVIHNFGYPNINQHPALKLTENFWNQSNMVSHVIPQHYIFEINQQYIYDTYPVQSIPNPWPPIDVPIFNIGYNANNNLAVGINTANPAYMLDVNGDMNVSWGITTSSLNSGRIDCSDLVVIGNVSTPSGYKLYVEEGILAEKIKVAVPTTADWSDFVFNENYKLTPLEKLEGYIKEHKHLPDVPSATTVVENGINLAKMDATLLQKIEELTLYVIDLKKENEKLKGDIRELKQIIK